MHDLDKENRPLPAMALPSKKIGAMTPSRRKKSGNDNKYFDVGKVGRKTGVTLRDTGVRDEFGLEPIAGIFSSPVSPQRRAYEGSGTLTSSDMLVQESSAPEVNETLILRKTPRLPPPRSSTPKHTHIGSPKRGSTGRPISRGQEAIADADHTPSRQSMTQPPANRVLDFIPNGAEIVRTSIEMTQSPFKPKRALRRSMGSVVRQDPFALVPSPAKEAATTNIMGILDIAVEEAEEIPQLSEVGNQLQPDDDEAYNGLPNQSDEQIEEAISEAQKVLTSSPKRKQGRPRKSVESANDSQTEYVSLTRKVTGSKKRARSSTEGDDTVADQAHVSRWQAEDSPVFVHKKKRGRTSKESLTTQQVHNEPANVDPTLLAGGDFHTLEADEEREVTESAPSPERQRPSAQRTKKKPKSRVSRAPTAPSGVPLNGGLLPRPTRGPSLAPTSNVNLRATTPFEDAGERVSRYGRAVIKPLNFWEGESYVWKDGRIEGVVRAESMAPESRKGRRKSKKTRVTKAGGKRGGLSRIDEEEDSGDESCGADEWEGEVGVLAGSVAAWDVELGVGNAEEPVREDLAFASSAIQTRPVEGSNFRYAKILTLPFFGAGVVELPPGGFKRTKNSRKMQMVFFVLSGKVRVEVGGAGGPVGEDEVDATKFAISRGGVWVVPRGNNYAITKRKPEEDCENLLCAGV